MKTLIIILLATISLNAQSFFDDYTFKNNSLDMIVNPASIVMGESFVANNKNLTSFLENPAALSEKNNAGLFYNVRYHNWTSVAKKFQYSSSGVVLNTSLGTIGIAYNQFTSGPVEMLQYSEMANQTLTIAIAKKLTRSLTLGASIKSFGSSISKMPGAIGAFDSKSAILFDIGALYSVNLSTVNDRLVTANFGAALQNFGTDYKEKANLLGTVSGEYFIVRLPRYLKLGFALIADFKNNTGGSDAEVTITGQYKSFINPNPSDKANVDYWGTGAEFVIKDIFVARAGFYQTPEYWMIYDRAKPLFRYGFGLKAPLKKIGINLPLVLSADFSFIPINNTDSPLFGAEGQKKILNAFGISLQYGSDLF